ncbi:putative feruloyl esterase B-2 [Massariosphaeria phaeospora]|uniref:Carboxylic ester hydrolase n=1 Tax=Massariosphaeria phaeospora TaxID=100035 RepID=A0A7C8HZ31_9PLEO|nr:putative feruloyl esterase B-2 [Massariosphaeria phaeospora]
MKKSTLLGLAFLVPTTLSNPTPGYGEQSFAERCTSLANDLTVSAGFAVHVNIAQHLPAGTIIDNAAEGVNETCADVAAPALPASICRLALRIATSDVSETLVETWLPEEWNGRFLATGNSGMAGCVAYPELAYGTSYGFATIGTDNGHNGTSGEVFYLHPGVLEDYVWRAIYAGTVVGKDLTRQFYGAESCKDMKAYFVGCSTGGRQGFKAAQNNPELFDGVVAGAPVIYLMSLQAWYGTSRKLLTSNTSEHAFVGPDHWALVQTEVLKQCDGLDGAHDGIVEDVRACQPDLTRLLCTTTSSPRASCLTAPQLSTITTLFSPLTTANGTLIHAGPSHSFEPSLTTVLTSPLVFTYLNDWFRGVVYSDRSWSAATFSPADAEAVLTHDRFDAQSSSPDLSAFRARGGKLLHWHGQADSVLPISMSDRHYARVGAALNASVAELDDFYRYFRISGMDHCFGGPGASFLGQTAGMVAGDDAEDNLLTRIVAWVEGGEAGAPETVRGTKFVDDSVEAGVKFTRRHCKFPRVNVYRGEEVDGRDEEGWACVEDQ